VYLEARRDPSTENAGSSGLHGYSHENPVKMTLQQQKDILDHTHKLLTEFCGKPPKGAF
jgi:peptidoglycan/xylan/chitin deacetylase (PgdA/CDA1 family)